MATKTKGSYVGLIQTNFSKGKADKNGRLPVFFEPQCGDVPAFIDADGKTRKFTLMNGTVFNNTGRENGTYTIVNWTVVVGKDSNGEPIHQVDLTLGGKISSKEFTREWSEEPMEIHDLTAKLEEVPAEEKISTNP